MLLLFNYFDHMTDLIGSLSGQTQWCQRVHVTFDPTVPTILGCLSRWPRSPSGCSVMRTPTQPDQQNQPDQQKHRKIKDAELRECGCHANRPEGLRRQQEVEPGRFPASCFSWTCSKTLWPLRSFWGPKQQLASWRRVQAWRPCWRRRGAQTGPQPSIAITWKRASGSADPVRAPANAADARWPWQETHAGAATLSYELDLRGGDESDRRSEPDWLTALR